MAETKIKKQAMNSDTRLDSKLISIARDTATASGDVSYTGVGFKPTALVVLANIAGKTNNHAIGMVDSALTEGSIIQDAAGAFYSLPYLLKVESSGGNGQYCVVKSFDDDGFTLTWTKVGSPTGTIDVKVLCFR